MRFQTPLLAIPVKPFGVAKQRLHPRLDAPSRSRLGREVARRTALVASATGATVVFVTGDSGVRRWAESYGYPTLAESRSNRSGLDGAASAVRDHAMELGRPWLVLHADLPLISVNDISALLEPLTSGRPVIAPSYDGGTAALGGHRFVEFAYGSGSYRRHLREVPNAAVIVRPGLAHDLDTVADLDEIVTRPGGQWINQLLATIDSCS
ncbi:MAG: NTP transferase domain-containing protein [bacterium]|nr:NTP transferase domain-containing protein [bacterium]